MQTLTTNLLHHSFLRPVIEREQSVYVCRRLSCREKEILQLAADGKSNREIAMLLFLSEDTIETHNRNIVCKSKATNMKHAIAIGIRNKVIE